MKALFKLKDGPDNIALKDIDEPAPGPGEVKIKVAAAGICGTDIKIRHGHTWSNPPVILGHEFSGTIVAVGDAVKNWSVNDRVVSETAQVICGHCEYCRTGSYLMCKDRLSIGYGVNGAFAEYCVVRQDLLHRLSDSIDFNSGSLCEPLAVAVHAVYKKVDLSPTNLAVVFGPGPIGLLTAQLLKSFGATVLICGLSADSGRLKLAKELGIDHAINLESVDLEMYLKDELHCQGIDIVFDCSGTNAAISNSLELLKKKGALVQIGLPNASMVLEYGKIVNKELSIIGSFGHSWIDWERALALIASGKVLTKPLITHEFPLSQWEKAFEVAENGTGIKVLIHPQL